jgi:hypothetical protein
MFDSRVKLRDLEENDIPLFLNYWYKSPEAFLRGMGVDPNKMLPPHEFETSLRATLEKNVQEAKSKMPFLTIELDGRAVGSHSIGDLVEGDTAVFHAHVWDQSARRIGLCTYTYPRAAMIFMDRFSLKELLFKTPSLNPGANRIKQKLGIECTGEESISYPFMLPNLTARVYRLSRESLGSLLKSQSQ